MNFSFELQGAAMTGSVSPEAMTSMSKIFGPMLGGLAVIRMIVVLGITTLMIISRWRVFKKAGLPGWGIFIPFYNRYLMFKVGGRSGRNVLWILIPPVFGILMIINYFKIARRFGKHPAYGLGIRFIRCVFIPILAFDNSKYLSKKVTTKSAVKPMAKAPAKKVIKKKAPAKKVKILKKK